MNWQLCKSELIQAERAVIKLAALTFVSFEVAPWELVITVFADHSIGATFSFVFVEVVRVRERLFAELTDLGRLPTVVLVMWNFIFRKRFAAEPTFHSIRTPLLLMHIKLRPWKTLLAVWTISRCIAIPFMLLQLINWLLFLAVSTGSRATGSRVLGSVWTWHGQLAHGAVIVRQMSSVLCVGRLAWLWRVVDRGLIDLGGRILVRFYVDVYQGKAMVGLYVQIAVLGGWSTAFVGVVLGINEFGCAWVRSKGRIVGHLDAVRLRVDPCTIWRKDSSLTWLDVRKVDSIE